METATALSSSAATTLLRRLDGLLLYRAVLERPGLEAGLAVLRAGCEAVVEPEVLLRAYGHWFETMAATGLDWPSYVIEQVLLAENPWTQRLAAADGQLLEEALKDRNVEGMVMAARQDLATLQQLCAWGGEGLSEWVARSLNCPEGQESPGEFSVAPAPWQPSVVASMAAPASLAVLPETVSQLRASQDWASELAVFFDHCCRRGVGQWGRYRAFRWQGTQLNGIAHLDPVRLDQLVGYEQPKQQLLANTERLLQGKPALNVLLYGSRGAGKSSLVKALVNAFGDRGLRLIEVAKADLQQLPQIVDELRSVAQKFILFVDDLSFDADDEAFKALKVVLEGSATARPGNVVVYATSNRRHLVREFFDDRPRPKDADEIHNWDTVQEKLSFSDRFGLTLTFGPADQDSYLAMVNHLVAQAGLKIDSEDLDFRARQWATRNNGRSGRTARQFVDWLQGEIS